jgi:hypothetical protein
MNGNGNGNGPTARGNLKALLVAGLLVVTLTFGLGIAAVGAAVVGVTGVAIGAAAGGVVVAHGACASVQADLARDLGLTVDELRAADPATFRDRIAARVASKALTVQEAQESDERAEAYTACRQVFGDAEHDWHVRMPR